MSNAFSGVNGYEEKKLSSALKAVLLFNFFKFKWASYSTGKKESQILSHEILAVNSHWLIQTSTELFKCYTNKENILSQHDKPMQNPFNEMYLNCCT